MYERPKNVVLASTVAIIGGLVSIAFLATTLMNIDADKGTFIPVAIAMLMAVLFFGFAGQCFPDGKGDYTSLVCLGLITVIAAAAMIIVDIDNNLYFGIALFIIAAVECILVLPARTEKWIRRDRA